MRLVLSSVVVFMFMLLFLSQGLSAQENTVVFDKAMKTRVVTGLIKLLDEYYVFPDVAKKIDALLKKNLNNGVYEKITDPEQFAKKLAEDCYAESKDLHFDVKYSKEFTQHLAYLNSMSEEDKTKATEQQIAEHRKQNFGFEKVEFMKGNVGYVKFNFFSEGAEAYQKAAAAMNFVADCDAVILDLRENVGGTPEMVQFIISYFYTAPVLINTMYYRVDKKTNEFWTLPYVPGKRMDTTELYVLISKGTGSAAEEFSYDILNLKRGTLIGETTAGAGHLSTYLSISDDFLVKMPYGRPINPISKTGWEGVGVKPDVAIASEKALEKAYEMALDSIVKKTTDPQKKFAIEWVVEKLKVINNPVIVSTENLQKYVGKYGERMVTMKDGILYYQRGQGKERKLVPINEKKFFVEGVDYFRIEFLVDDKGTVTTLNGLYDDGRNDPTPRDK